MNPQKPHVRLTATGTDWFQAEEQQRLFRNAAAAMAGVPEEIVQRQLVHFHKADPRYADGVAKALGLKNRAAGK